MDYSNWLKKDTEMSETPEHKLIDDAYEKANQVEKDYQINESSFRDLYGDKNVDKDEKEVKRLENIFENQKQTVGQKESQKLAKILENIFFEQIELSEWLGSNAFSMKTSKYDDYKNGIDMISEFIEENDASSYLGLAVDATFSKDIKKKIDRVKKDIREGHLSKVKYFDSEMTDIRGELSNIPRVIIGAIPEKIKEISKLWVDGKRKELGSHPIQFNILEEISLQLKAFKIYARSYNKDKLASIYERLEKRINNILKEKKKTITQGQLKELRGGVLFERIKKETEQMINEALDV